MNLWEYQSTLEYFQVEIFESKEAHEVWKNPQKSSIFLKVVDEVYTMLKNLKNQSSLKIFDDPQKIPTKLTIYLWVIQRSLTETITNNTRI